MNQHNRRALLGAGSGGAIAALLAACGQEPQAQQPSTNAQPTAGAAPDREVVFAIARDLGNGPEDPFFTHSSVMHWEPLVALDNALKPTPALAEKWDLSADGKTWTFTLRQNVKFSDGTPFDADAVVKNMQRYMKISPRTSPFTTMDVRIGYGKLTDVRKVDARTVTFHLDDPAPWMPATMSNFFSAMYSPASFDDAGNFTAAMPVATGPYKLTEFKRGEYMTLERNENYWGTKPAVRRYRLRTIPDANARVSAIIAKEVDAVAELGALLPAQAQQLKSQPGVTVGNDPISISQYIAFNCSKAPFDDPKLRQAVGMAVDRTAIVKDLVLGYATEGKSLLSPFSTQWFSAKGTPKYDMFAAQKLAGEALGNKRVVAVLPYSSSAGQARPYKQIAELLQQVLRPMGIDVQIQALENAALTDATNRGEWNLRFGQQGWANGDPDFIFSAFIASTGGYNTTSKGGYKNEEADRLIAQGKTERDEKRRFTIYERLQELAVQEMPVLPLYHEHAPYAFRDSISGLKQRITYQPTLEAVKIVK
jgi:peptide/nickel transport system substrate-binding protein